MVGEGGAGAMVKTGVGTDGGEVGGWIGGGVELLASWNVLGLF